ncbi:thymidylate kinase [Dictyostelium purpureum]|uniref:Thymidylate kinase n=1 Tax=Dictyostelium purpureum TaxID=5786 RepID=F0ZQC1_DICPU|nr:thymidylate kinase [Dictyostelium purpureum]EGC33878.1 thymidylate kinase [Dictyostelium purpureum]|eukprot:XP_003289616.1 thymidylate kinase [Dictyostelium purpureum]
MTKRGLFILFEGADRVGKSTQVQSLTNHISNSRNLPTKSLRFPDRTTPIGQILNQYLQNSTNMDDRALHLLFSSNRWEAKDSILELLNSGTNIVVDRYSYSGVAYTAAKGIDVDWCYSCESGLPEPDIVFYLSMSTEDATKRGDYGGERYEKRPSWKVINANRTVEEVSNEINQIFDFEFESLQKKPIGTLK